MLYGAEACILRSKDMLLEKTETRMSRRIKGVTVFFFRTSSYHVVNSVCCSHALVSGPTSKMPASDGGRCDSNGQREERRT